MLVVVAELLTVASFASVSYTWWWKANDPAINAGIETTAIWCLASLGAIAVNDEKLSREILKSAADELKTQLG